MDLSDQVNRRDFARRGFVASIGIAAMLRGAGRERPNIFVAISDDQSWLHTSAEGDPVVKTPVFDRIAQQGVRFTSAFCCAPSCTPSRGGLLTGQHIWRLEEGANLFSTLPAKFEVYPDILESAGYHVGYMGKGWGPGNFRKGGRTRNPAGPAYDDFDQFSASVPRAKPFCFWFGSHDPHRGYVKGSGLKAGLRLDDVQVPAWLPDDSDVRSDMLDYFFAIRRFDRDLGRIIERIEKAGQLENTLVVVTSDNGMPFPRAKATVYDSGTRMPLAIRWPARIPGGRVVEDLVGHVDLAPTLLEAAGIAPRPQMNGRSLLKLLESRKPGLTGQSREFVLSAMERHTNSRAGGAGYPMRALRTRDYLYIRNFEPDRWPAGDPEDYGEIANCPSKASMLKYRDDPKLGRFFRMACAKRPAEELFDLKKDPDQLNNAAGRPEYADIRKSLRTLLDKQLIETRDPRMTGGPIIWDSIPYKGQGQ
jgi:uncharacterized sulfatase